MICKKCELEKRLSYCEDCYLKLQGKLFSRLMKGDPNYQIMDSVNHLKWDIQYELKFIKKEVEDLKNVFKDFKIRGLKLKSVKI